MIRIITDSTCDISKADQEKLNIDILPLTVSFGNESFLDGVTLSHDEFYQRLAKSQELPKTTQINPSIFFEIFTRYLEAGDDIVGIFLSSKMSGTFQSAAIAASSMPPDRVFVIDSKTVTCGLGLLVNIAANLRASGESACDISKKITELTYKTKIVASFDTLKYLRAGGRMSALSSIIGSTLGICPVILLEDGVINMIKKSRSRKQSYQHMLDYVFENPMDESYPISIGYVNNEILRQLSELTKPHFDLDGAILCHLGCIVGTHTGPGGIGLAYIIK